MDSLLPGKKWAAVFRAKNIHSLDERGIELTFPHRRRGRIPPSLFFLIKKGKRGLWRKRSAIEFPEPFPLGGVFYLAKGRVPSPRAETFSPPP